MQRLSPQPLSAEAFAPYGEVIETRNRDSFPINNGTTRRYHRLAEVDLGGGDDRAILSIFHASPLPMPLRVKMLERHPLGSQAFMPLQGDPFLILVAPPAEQPNPQQLRAFISDGRQGVNYYRGVWHHPLLACVESDFLVVDRAGPGSNCDEYFFPAEIEIVLDPDHQG